MHPACSCCCATFATADGDILVNGFSDNAEGVMPGDIYCCIDHVSAMDVIDAHDAYYLQEAVQNGAVAVVAEAGRQLPEFPEDIPIIYAEDVQELATRLAAVFYGEPTLISLAACCVSQLYTLQTSSASPHSAAVSILSLPVTAATGMRPFSSNLALLERCQKHTMIVLLGI